MGSVRARRPTKRRRVAPEEPWEWWETIGNPLLMLRSQGRCERCGADLNRTGVERHHRIRRRDGGDRLSNLLALCPSCHHWVTDHPTEAIANGWSVRALDEVDPSTVPVRINGYLWLIDDYGKRRMIP